MGELAKEVLKGTNYGKSVFAEDDKWSLELGDVLFSLICLANTTGVDLREGLNMVLDKYEKRFLGKGDISSL